MAGFLCHPILTIRDLKYSTLKQFYSVYTILLNMRYQIYLFVLYQSWQNHIYQEMETNFVKIVFVSKTRSFQCKYYCRTQPAATIGGKLVEWFRRKVMAVAHKIFSSSPILREISNTLHPPYLGVMLILR